MVRSDAMPPNTACLFARVRKTHGGKGGGWMGLDEDREPRVSPGSPGMTSPRVPELETDALLSLPPGYVGAQHRFAPTTYCVREAAFEDGMICVRRVGCGCMRSQVARDWNEVHSPLIEAFPELLGGVTFEVGRPSSLSQEALASDPSMRRWRRSRRGTRVEPCQEAFFEA